VIPFIAVIAVPEQVLTYPFISNFLNVFGVTSGDEMILPLALLFICSAVLSGVFRIGVLWATTRLSAMIGVDLSLEAYRRTLNQPYSVHVRRNSSVVLSGITKKIDYASSGLVQPLLNFMSSLFMILAIGITLFLIHPVLAVATGSTIAIGYSVIAMASRRRLRRHSEIIALGETRRLQAVQEGLGGIRDVILGGSQSVYCDIFGRSDGPTRRARGSVLFISSSPRVVMEVIAVILLAGLAFGLTRQPGELVSMLPTLGALTLGAQRLFPAFQQAYASWSNIMGARVGLVDALELLEQPLPYAGGPPDSWPISFKHEIRFERV
ncbi:uncharacterized protein METZ01_LOCUS343124, partial [marine metagenome]